MVNVTTSRWYHIACSYDGQTAKIYLDGRLISSTSVAATINYSSVGALGIKAFPDGSSNMNGKMDDVRIYNYALTADQIKAAMNQGSGARY